MQEQHIKNTAPYDLCSLFQSWCVKRVPAFPEALSRKTGHLKAAGMRFAQKDCGLCDCFLGIRVVVFDVN
jgi:hypothetical protein